MSIVKAAYLNSLEEDGKVYTLSDYTISSKSITASNITCESKTTGATFSCSSAKVAYNKIGDNILVISVQNITIDCRAGYPSSGECLVKFPKPSSGYFIQLLKTTDTDYAPSISNKGSNATITVTGD